LTADGADFTDKKKSAAIKKPRFLEISRGVVQIFYGFGGLM
jgi:hypothetical protein